MARLGRSSAYKLIWNGKNVAQDNTKLAWTVYVKLLIEAQRRAKESLVPGRGFLTGTMQRSVHIANEGYNWAGDHVEPDKNTPERGDSFTFVLGDPAPGRFAFEFGSGQNYAVIFHQNVYPFLLRQWQWAHKGLKKAVEDSWQNP